MISVGVGLWNRKYGVSTSKSVATKHLRESLGATDDFDRLLTAIRNVDDGVTVGDEIIVNFLRTFEESVVAESTPTSVLMHTLTVVVGNGGASVTRDPVGTSLGGGIYVYPEDTEVELTPEMLNYNFNFDEWTGDVAEGHESDNPLTLTMTENCEVTATFVLKTYKLEYVADATGGYVGTVSPSSDVVQYRNLGESGAQVTAVPDQSYHFTRWSDDVMTASRTDTNVSGNISVIAYFEMDE